ncbi:hypothetical protein [Flammeovirga pacifica]|uniref:Anti-sigma factor n=1 Tax=Flammeovirga pacifica TaxID=915059 RepID=A0A1S1YY41_FLAPC|nr:hypothetical protein [Flammeovirga pacifica]OHX65926.1 hypothetical protein NH26_05935 [Flammeovirga pacifica]
MEKLEKYILENKSSLDVYTPSTKCNDRFKSLLFDDIEKIFVSQKSLLDKEEASDKVWDNIAEALNDQTDEPTINISSPKSLDKFEAPSNLWDKISTELDQDEILKNELTKTSKNNTQTKEVTLKFIYKWLSSVAAAIVIGISIGLLFNQSNTTPIESNSVAGTKTEWKQAEQYFHQVIDSKQLQIKKLNYQDVRLLSDFDSQLGTLKDNYKDLKKELKTSPQPEIIKKQMIIVLELQVELLNKQMEIIIDQNKEESQNENIQQYNI